METRKEVQVRQIPLAIIQGHEEKEFNEKVLNHRDKLRLIVGRKGGCSDVDLLNACDI